MKRFGPYLLTLAAFVMSGCLPSTHPFYTNDNVTELPWVDGKWQKLADDGTIETERPWVFKGNTINALDEKGRRGTLNATYFSVNKITFADTTSDSDEVPGSDWTRIHLLPIHQLHKVERFGDRLVLTPMDYEWVTKGVKDGRIELRHELIDNAVLFTCSPHDWEKFLTQYGSDTNVFSGTVRYNFRLVQVEETAKKPEAGRPAQ